MKIVSFDCYGTLVDWEKGIISSLRTIFEKYEVDITDEEILEIYSIIESRLEKNYIPYKEILKKIVIKFSDYFDFDLERGEENALLNNWANFELFEDVNETLKEIKKRGYKIAIISNVDNDLFELTKKKFEFEIDYIITSEMVKAYKPSKIVFEYALKVFNSNKDEILHTAQSYYHDIIPAKELGIKTAHIKRRGFGATPRVEIVNSDYEFENLREMLSIL
ncbi:MAG: HAD-IA family hydrolase [Candidatus Hydrothermia bacterium]|nr:HAD-IA family hydrolase [Candidatus Hydrothermia bacterium]